MSYHEDSNTLYSGSEGGIISKINLSSQSPNDNGDTNGNGAKIDLLTNDTKQLQHDHHITALITNDRYIITGCKDSCIRVFDIQTNQRLFILSGKSSSGHEKPVTSLSFLNFNDEKEEGTFFVSGSWDGTAKIWYLNENSNSSTHIHSCDCCATLDGHENTVSVQGLPPPAPSSSSSSSIAAGTNTNTMVARLATGSAGIATGNSISDYKIRMYQISCNNSTSSSSPSSPPSLTVSLKSTISNDHHGPIRSLSFDQKLQLLLSCSNDGSVKIRDDTGACVQTLDFNLLFTATTNEEKSDDKGNDTFIQEMKLQLQNSQPPMLLDVATNHNDSIVACGEDGTVIIWSTTAASTSTMTTDIQTQIIPHPNCVWKVLTLPNGDIITACNDGFIRIFTKDKARFASQELTTSFWDTVKEAKQKKSNGPSQEEINKLPKWEMNFNTVGKSEGAVQVFNKSGKAIAAQWSQASKTWIEVGEVTGQADGGGSSSAGMIEGVAYDFVFPIEIDVSGGGVQTLKIGYNNGENPFVTAQAFIDQYMLDQGYLAQIADYIRTRVGQDGHVPTIGTEGVGSDGAGDITPTPMDYTLTPTPSYQHIPMKGYKSFETGADMKTLRKAAKKIAEFNSALNTNLTSDELNVGLENLLSTIAATSRYHATTVSELELQLIQKMMKNWSLVNVFPAMDIARLLVLHPDASAMKRSGYWIENVCLAIEKCDLLQKNINDIAGPAKVAIPMLSMRLFANCFRGGNGSKLAVESHLAR